MKKVKTIDLLEKSILLPPHPSKCQECATDHRPDQPHQADTMFYKMRVMKQHKRWPTWKDAMAHCSDQQKQWWTEQLAKHGVEV